MPEQQPAPRPTPKPKKSVALSGVATGNAALCTARRVRRLNCVTNGRCASPGLSNRRE